MADYQQLQRMVAESRVGSSVTLEVFRKKQKVNVSVKVAEVPDERPRRPEGKSPSG